MTILDIQRRYVEIGRIRMGQKGSRGEPKRLDTWRLTSSNRAALEEAAALWGGEVTEWTAAPTPGQHELFTASASLPIIVPPGPEPASQWFEQWNRGGATHRCDGVTNHITDEPCSCDPDARACKITTRVNVMLPDLPGLGVWRFETHGYYAATELPGTIELIRSAAERGTMLPGTLRIEQRQRVAGGRTTRFPVAVIDLDLNLRQLASGGGVTPVAAIPAPSVAKQLEAANEPHERPRRTNAAAVLPPTDVEVVIDDPQDRRTETGSRAPDQRAERGAQAPPDGAAAGAERPVDNSASVPAPSGPVISEAQRRRLFAIAKECGIGNDKLKVLVAGVAGVESSKDIPLAEYDAVIDTLRANADSDELIVAGLEKQFPKPTAYDHPDAP